MFELLPSVCRELHGNIQDIYWILLVPFTVLLIALSFFKMPEQNPNGGEVLKRAFVSILLLISFEECMGLISTVSDGVTERIQGIQKLKDLLDHLAPTHEEQEIGWLDFKQAIVYVLNLFSYMVAYIGIFVANALIHFVWSVLYICSPLMILAYVSKRTAFVTLNLYKSLISVTVWKVLWSLLGVILLKTALYADLETWDNFLTTITFNLLVGFSMLFIPFATRSLISDGMFGMASQISATATHAVTTGGKGLVMQQGKVLAGRAFSGAKNRMSLVGNKLNQTKANLQRRFHKPRGPVRGHSGLGNVLYPDFSKNRGGDDNHDKT